MKKINNLFRRCHPSGRGPPGKGVIAKVIVIAKVNVIAKVIVIVKVNV